MYGELEISFAREGRTRDNNAISFDGPEGGAGQRSGIRTVNVNRQIAREVALKFQRYLPFDAIPAFGCPCNLGESGRTTAYSYPLAGSEPVFRSSFL
jgi:hypothetical protein